MKAFRNLPQTPTINSRAAPCESSCRFCQASSQNEGTSHGGGTGEIEPVRRVILGCPCVGRPYLGNLVVWLIRGIDGNSYSSRRGTTWKPLCGNREFAGVTVRKDGGCHDL